jgi:hypothetical protein
MFSRIWKGATTLLQAPQRIGGAFFRLEGSRRALINVLDTELTSFETVL